MPLRDTDSQCGHFSIFYVKTTKESKPRGCWVVAPLDPQCVFEFFSFIIQITSIITLNTNVQDMNC